MTIKREYKRATNLLVLALIAILWVFINSGHYVQAGLIYVVMIASLILLYRNWDIVGVLSGKLVKGKGGENRLVGIGDRFGRDLVIGLIAAGGYILLNQLDIIGAIGIPSVQAIADNIGKFMIIVVVAPIVEELFFRDVVLDYFDRKLLGNLPFIIAAVGSAVVFSLFHFVAYGSSLTAAGGSFMSAGIFGFSAAYIRKYTNSNSSNIIFHMIINLWIGFITLSVIIG